MATNDFSPINKIGEGGFGVVYKVIELTFLVCLHLVLKKILIPSVVVHILLL